RRGWRRKQFGRCHPSLEVSGVKLNLVGTQGESAAAGDDATSCSGAQAGNVAPQRVIGAWRRLTSPQRVDKGVCTDMMVRMSGQHREHSALVGAGRRHVL